MTRKSKLIDFNEFEKRFPKVKKSKKERKKEAKEAKRRKRNDIWTKGTRLSGAGFSKQ
jgi:hypothetical protein